MKNKFGPLRLLLSCLLIGLIAACNKESSDEINITDPGLKLYKSFLAIDDMETRQAAYGTLSSQEKFEFWQAKFSKDISSGQFSDEQINRIKDFAHSVKPEFFTKGDKKEIFKSITLPNWIKDNATIFTADEVFDLFFNININTAGNFSKKAISRNSVAAKDCHCAVGSRYTCYIGGGQFGTCTRVLGCTKLSTGCGALWDDECDGDFCTQMPLVPYPWPPTPPPTPPTPPAPLP